MPEFTNLDDFVKYYHKAVVFDYSGEKRHVLQILDIGPSTDEKKPVRIKGQYLTRNYTWRAFNKTYSYNEIAPFTPEPGFVNWRDIPVWLGRTARKQWRRSYNDKSYRLHGIIPRGFSSASYAARVELPSWNSGELIKDLVLREFYSFSDAVDLLKKGEVLGAAFHPLYALSYYHKSLPPAVFYKKYPIGVVTDGVVRIPQQLAEFSQALSDFVPVEVVNNE